MNVYRFLATSHKNNSLRGRWAVLLRFSFCLLMALGVQTELKAQKWQKKTPSTSTADIINSYTIQIPGVLQTDGTYSLGKILEVQRPAKGTYTPGTILVKTKRLFEFNSGKKGSVTSFPSSVLMTTMDGFGVKHIKAAFPEYNSGNRISSDRNKLGYVYEVRYSAPVEPFDFCRELMNNPEVEYAEPVYIMRLHHEESPSDSLYARQYAWQRIMAEKAWELVQGDASVVIAIIDSGVDWEHEDLADNIWTNPGESGKDTQGRDKRSNGVDDDNNGKIDDWHGWDFVGSVTDAEEADGIFNPDNDPKPRGNFTGESLFSQSHGTHVAGIACGVTNNNKGIAGAAFNCRILPLKVSSDNIDDAIFGASYTAMLYAAQMGAQIINASWGGVSGGSAIQQDVINTVTAMGTLVVASAGNGDPFSTNHDLMDGRHFPSSYDNVLSVGVSDANDAIVSTANGHFFGSTVGVKTTVYAPGFNFLSTLLDNRYGFESGTSMSSPLVAGIAALVKKQHPDWSPRQILQQIRSTSDNVFHNGFNLGTFGNGAIVSERPIQQYGRINAFRAVSINRTLNEGADVVPGLSNVGAFITAPNGIIGEYRPVRLFIRVQNFLSNASSVQVSIESLDGRAIPQTSSVNVGDITSLEQKTAEFALQLQPTTLSSANADFLVTYRSGNYVNYERISVPFSLPARSKTPQLAVTAGLDFGATALPLTQTITVRNTGNQKVTVSSAQITGKDSTEFLLTEPFSPFTLDVNASRLLLARFQPVSTATAVAGTRSAALSLKATSDGINSLGAGVVNYAFESYRGTYNEFTDGIELDKGSGVDDKEYSADIGFSFRLGNRTYTQLRVSSNGFVVFEPRTTLVAAMDAVFAPLFDDKGSLYTGAIAAFATDIQLFNNGDIRTKLEGTAPNRVFVIQWRNATFWGENAPRPEGALNFQIRLYETNNLVEIVYGNMRFNGSPLSPADGIGQVGLRGESRADFNSRMVRTLLGNTWESSQEVRANDDPVEGSGIGFCQLAGTLAPPNGLTYRWTYQDPSSEVAALSPTVALRGTYRSGAFISSTSAGVSFGTSSNGTVTVYPVVLRNQGTTPAIIRSISFVTTATTDVSEYSIVGAPPTSIGVGQSITLQVQFKPLGDGPRPAQMVVESNAPNFTLAMTGIAVRVVQPDLRFGFTGVADFTGGSTIFSRFERIPQNAGGQLVYATIGTIRTMTDLEMRNRGTKPITLTGYSIVGVGSSEFTILEPKFPITIQSGQSVAMKVQFAPRIAGEKLVDVFFIGDFQRATALGFGAGAALPRFAQVTPRGNDPIFNEGVALELFSLPLNDTKVGESSTVALQLKHNILEKDPATITNISFTGEAAGDYTLEGINAKFPMSLMPGETKTVVIRFKPTIPGKRLAKVLITAASGSPTTEELQLEGIGTTAKTIFLSRTSMVFKTTEPATQSESLSGLIFGVGNAPVTVSKIMLEGTHNNEFVFDTLSEKAPKTLKPDSSMTVIVRFAPKSLGRKEARILIESDRQGGEKEIRTIELFGTAGPITSATIQMLSVSAPPGATVELPVVIFNRKNVPNNSTIYADVRLNASLLEPVDTTPAGTVIDGQRIIPLTLSTGDGKDTVLTRLRFRSILGTDTTTALQLGGNSREVPVAALSGKFSLIDVPSVSIDSSNYSAYPRLTPEDLVIVTLRLKNLHNIPAVGAMTVTLQYNASLLEITKDGIDATYTTSVANGTRTITFSIPRSTTPDKTITLKFGATVGNAVSTELKLTQTFVSGLKLSPKPALFTLKGLNQAGGTQQFITPTTLLSIVNVTPNPGSDKTSVLLSVQEPTPLTVSLFDTYGRLVKTLRFPMLSAGETSIDLPLYDVASGLYTVTFTGSRQTTSIKVSVLK